MNRQLSFSQREYAGKKRVTRKEAFLAVMEEVVPWKELVERLEVHYPKGERGRPPTGLERMLRLLVVQNCFGLSDVGVKVRYRGLRKNVAKLEILFALANLVKAKGWIMSPVPA